MSRNKYPKQTIDKILEVSSKLFLEKGYDNTSLQDIINELGNLTKGAIYHHFKSKEDIFNAVACKLGENNEYIYHIIKNDESLSGVDKLKKLVTTNIENVINIKLLNATPNLLDNPKFLSLQLKEIKEVITPKYIIPIIEDGILDSSIKTNKPSEVAEAISLMINIWINPVIYGDDINKLPSKCDVINEFTSNYGFELFDKKTINNIIKIISK